MEYRVKISERLCRTVNIEADSRAEACRIARKQYRDCKVVLGGEDFVGVDFNATPLYYRSPNCDLTLLHGDCTKLLPQFDFKFDIVFADPPYFLSNGGISVQSGRVVCVDKGGVGQGQAVANNLRRHIPDLALMSDSKPMAGEGEAAIDLPF